MQTNEDVLVNTDMSFKQIIDICDLVLEADNLNKTTILTIRDIAEQGGKNLKNFKS